MIEEMTTSAAIEELVARVKPILAGEGPGNQGGALGELVAMWLAGHPPDLREQLLKLWLEMMLGLMHEYSKDYRGTRGPAIDTADVMPDKKLFH